MELGKRIEQCDEARKILEEAIIFVADAGQCFHIANNRSMETSERFYSIQCELREKIKMIFEYSEQLRRENAQS